MDPFGPLESWKDEIRLLRLDLSTQPEKCSHRLVSHVPFRDPEAKYVALSYPWGDTTQHTSLLVEGRPVEVTVNFIAALDEVVQFCRQTGAAEKQDVYLWADQVCINSGDKEEKSHQVRMMSDIFRSADEVLIWLPLARSVRGSFSKFQDWANWHRLQLDPSRLSREDEMRYSVVGVSSDEYPVLTSEDRKDRESLSAWSNVYEIVQSAWWTRAWILQEFLAPEKAIFLVDGMAAPSDNLQDLLSAFCSRTKYHSNFLRSKETSLSKPEAPMPTVNQTAGCLDSCCGGSQRKMSADQQSLHASDHNAKKHQLSYIQKHINRYAHADEAWQRVNQIFDSRAQRLKNGPEHYSLLSDLLKQGRDSQSSEARDKVYAFLALATPSYGITPDYTLPANSVFQQTAQALITEERRLDILAIARENRRAPDGSGSESLPSWVPDWSDGHKAKTEYRKFLADIKFPVAKCKASGTIQAEVRFHNRFLEVKALRADRLREVLEDPPYRTYKRFKTNDGREVCTVKAAKEGDDVWVILGADEPFVLRKSGSYYTILGHAMIYEAQRASPIMNGALVDQLNSGRVEREDLQIA